MAGAISTGDAILATQALGADFAYIGSPFIAAEEARADLTYKQMVVDSTASDIVTTDAFTGVPANYLRPQVAALGLDPDAPGAGGMDTLDEGAGPKPWRDIWGAGEGIGAVREIAPVARIVDRLRAEYDAACARLS